MGSLGDGGILLGRGLVLARCSTTLLLDASVIHVVLMKNASIRENTEKVNAAALSEWEKGELILGFASTDLSLWPWTNGLCVKKVLTFVPRESVNGWTCSFSLSARKSPDKQSEGRESC